jgi:hypothetical protein
MKTEQILRVFRAQGFYCSARRIRDICPHVTEASLNKAIKEAKKEGLLNRSTYLTRQLSVELRALENKVRAEHEQKLERLIYLSFGE